MTCKNCQKEFHKNSASQTFCSISCRKENYSTKRTEIQLRYYDREASVPSLDKKMCIICEKYYKKVGCHIRMRHGMTCREYREEYNLPVKRGILTDTDRKKLASNCKKNGTIENLKKGAAFRYQKGDKRTKVNTYYKGKAGTIRYLPEDIY